MLIRKVSSAAACFTGALLYSTMTQAAVEFSIGEIEAALSSTVTYGVSWRVGGADAETLNGGGNANFDATDIVSNRFTGSHDLELTLKNYGAFFRVNYFYDHANDDLDPRTSAAGVINTRDSDDTSVNDLSMLDAYVYGYWDLFGGKFNARFGEQVISWGESTFIGNNLNEINTFDVTKIRAPGVELKDALLPNMAAYAAWQSFGGLSVEAFTLFDFDEVQLDAAGTFWNTLVGVGDGGLSLGPLSRRGNQYAKDSGQFGIAVRYFAAGLGEGVDFGSYYMKLHAHNPILSGIAGGGYFLEYPEDREIWGLSYNTIFGSWASSGEWSHRRNEPVQVSDFFLAALGLPAGALGLPNATPNFAPGDPAGTVYQGFDRVQFDQIQNTFQRVITPHFIGGDSMNTLIEVGYVWVSDKPSSLTPLHQIDSDAWGYRVRVGVTYNRAIAEVINLTPEISWRHDVDGVAGPFIEDAKTLALNLKWDYLVNLSGSFSITHNFDGSQHKNTLTGGPTRGDEDRSWLTASIKYEF
ncbi:MAG: DUF1302 family protein [Immundisolibacteraceae bacterium]|nr:DUF1302 family protein [Immundisolibacteraceae bacterium]